MGNDKYSRVVTTNGGVLVIVDDGVTVGDGVGVVSIVDSAVISGVDSVGIISTITSGLVCAIAPMPIIP